MLVTDRSVILTARENASPEGCPSAHAVPPNAGTPPGVPPLTRCPALPLGTTGGPTPESRAPAPIPTPDV